MEDRDADAEMENDIIQGATIVDVTEEMKDVKRAASLRRAGIDPSNVIPARHGAQPGGGTPSPGRTTRARIGKDTPTTGRKYKGRNKVKTLTRLSKIDEKLS